MSERVDIYEVQCFSAWRRHLTLPEGLLATLIAIETWCKRDAAGEIALGLLAVRAEMVVPEVQLHLKLMGRQGVFRRMEFTEHGTVIVELAPRWRMDEEDGDV